jgi:mRNA interferase HicA
MTTRRDITRRIRRQAKTLGEPLHIEEGRNHTKVWIGDRYTTVPRHREIPDRFATEILRQIGA